MAVGLENKLLPPEPPPWGWVPKVGAKTKSKASCLPRLASRLPGFPLLPLECPTGEGNFERSLILPIWQ